MKVLLVLLLFQLSSLVGAQLIVTHAQDDYSQNLESQYESQELVKMFKGSKYFLYNDISNWFTEISNADLIYSSYGEHSIETSGKDIVLMGNNLGACLQHSLIDIVKNRKNKQSFTVHIPTKTVIEAGGNFSLYDLLKNSDQADQLEILVYYFNRHQSYLKKDNKSHFRKWSRIKLDYFINGKSIGRIKNEKKKKLRNIDINLMFWDHNIELLEYLE